MELKTFFLQRADYCTAFFSGGTNGLLVLFRRCMRGAWALILTNPYSHETSTGMSGILKERHKFACHDVCFNPEVHEGHTKPRFHETSEILMECQESWRNIRNSLMRRCLFYLWEVHERPSSQAVHGAIRSNRSTEHVLACSNRSTEHVLSDSTTAHACAVCDMCVALFCTVCQTEWQTVVGYDA